MNIQENIKALRLQKRLSQLDVAYALSITQGTYAQLESGKTEITLNRIEQLAKLFGMAAIDILQYDGANNRQTKADDSQKIKDLEREIEDLKTDIITLKETIDLLKELKAQQKEIEKLRIAEISSMFAVVIGRYPDAENIMKNLTLSKEEIDFIHRIKTEIYNTDSFGQQFEKIYEN